jgi:hypothetical protein
MKRITYLIQSILWIGALLLSVNSTSPVQAAGINQKGLAVELSFADLVGAQPNFDLRGFTVVDGTLAAFGTVTWSVNGLAVGPLAFELPVTGISGSCDVLSVDIAGMDILALGVSLSFGQVDFDIHSGEITPNAVRNLLCTAARMAEGGANAYALAAALNRILPAIQ